MLECWLPFTSGAIRGFMMTQIFEMNLKDLRDLWADRRPFQFDGDWLIESVVFLRPFD